VLTEHMTYRAGDTLLQLERIGSTAGNGVTTADDTYYYAEAAPEALSSLLWLEARRMAFAAAEMTDGDLERERKIVVHEWRERSGQDAEWQESLWAGVYPVGHPYRQPLDRVHEVERTGLAHVQWFTQSHYRPERAHLVVVGRFDAELARAWIDQYFGQIRGTGPAATRSTPKPAQLGEVATVRHYALVAHESLAVIWPGPARGSREFAALNVAAELVSGLLDQRLVAGQGPASRAEATLEGREHDSWFVIDVTARGERKAETMLEEIDAVLQAVQSGALGAGLLELATRTLRKSRMRPSLAERALYRARLPAGTPPEADTTSYQAMDLAAVQSALQRWLPSGRRVIGIAERDWQ